MAHWLAVRVVEAKTKVVGNSKPKREPARGNRRAVARAGTAQTRKISMPIKSLT